MESNLKQIENLTKNGSWNLVRFAIKFRSDIINFAKVKAYKTDSVHINKEDLFENAITSDNIRYYLSKEHWTELYRMLIDNHNKLKLSNPSFKEYNTEIAHVKRKLRDIFSKASNNIPKNTNNKRNPDRPNILEPYYNVFLDYVNGDPDIFIEVVFNILQNRIFHMLDRNR